MSIVMLTIHTAKANKKLRVIVRVPLDIKEKDNCY